MYKTTSPVSTKHPPPRRATGQRPRSPAGKTTPLLRGTGEDLPPIARPCYWRAPPVATRPRPATSPPTAPRENAFSRQVGRLSCSGNQILPPALVQRTPPPRPPQCHSWSPQSTAHPHPPAR